MMRAAASAKVLGGVALLALLSPSALAAPFCNFTSVTGVGFGAYDVFSAAPNNNGVGSLRIRCQGGGKSAVVTLSAGQSGSYALRRMTSGSNRIDYNLYTSAARTVVWGDGTGGSATQSVASNSTTTLSVFGQIPAAQDAAVGVYSDNIIATVNF